MEKQLRQEIIDLLQELGYVIGENIEYTEVIDDKITLPGVELDANDKPARYICAKMSTFMQPALEAARIAEQKGNTAEEKGNTAEQKGNTAEQKGNHALDKKRLSKAGTARLNRRRSISITRQCALTGRDGTIRSTILLSPGGRQHRKRLIPGGLA